MASTSSTEQAEASGVIVAEVAEGVSGGYLGCVVDKAQGGSLGEMLAVG